VRLNLDGSVDFVSCEAVDDVVEASATATLRAGRNGPVDESTATSVNLDPPIDHLAAGQIIQFFGLGEDWDRLDIVVDGVDYGDGVFAYAERDQLNVGEWWWMDGMDMLSSWSRCEIDTP
jgi:hypothetical protein